MKSTLLTLLFAFTYLFSFAQCPPSTGISFSLNNTEGCDSLELTIINTSPLDLSTIAEFKWDFGDGSLIIGDSITNTAWWNGTNNDFKFNHTYNSGGSYLITLTVLTDSGCRDTAVSSIITVTEFDGKITHQEIGQSRYAFKFDNISPDLTYFLWNYGDPPSGPQNFDNQNIEGEHAYGVGAYLISFTAQVGGCLKVFLDTLEVHGPNAIIEVPFDRIPLSEKYQCGSNDSIHFTNHSSYYRNDDNSTDEDSIITVNGQSRLVFNYDLSTGQGDQSAITTAQHINNRGDSRIKRIWDFGDEFALPCTTSTAKGLNIGVNCNYSEDEFPVHQYKNWDSVYYNDYYLTNTPLCEVQYNSGTNSCVNAMIDTTDSRHEAIFHKTVAHNYLATLYLKDTVSGRESMSTVDIINTRPDASKLEVISGIECPMDGNNLDYSLHFDMNTQSQSYFAVNFDSFANPSNFLAFNSGAILAPPAPGTPIPFIYPYDLTGTYGDEFIKGYTAGEIGSPGAHPNDAITVGLIVGNGPLISGQPICVDTFWYHDLVQFQPLNANFDILEPSGTTKTMCKGDTAYFKIEDEIQDNIEVLRFYWGDQGVNALEFEQAYFEEFYYLEDYLGPSPSRNDRDINYSGQNWKYNYVVRKKLINSGIEDIDTIVSAIIKDWRVTLYDDAMIFLQDQMVTNMCYHEFTDEQLLAMLGDGTFGCIDTTGLSSFFELNYEEHNRNSESVIQHGNKRYRYTNAAKTDSLEIAHILHFRDSSLQGYDTLINGTDTTFGVWAHRYQYFDEKDSTLKDNVGPMVPTVFLRNLKGCERRGAELLNVGFMANFGLSDDSICEGLNVQLNDSIRYYQYGEMDPPTFPIWPVNYWHDPIRYLSNIEVFKADWDSTDGYSFERSLTLNQIYDDPGDYVVTVVAIDSNNCTDTTFLNVTATNLQANFGYIDQTAGCHYKVQFGDSTEQTGGYAPNSWTWDFGDGSPKSNLQHPVHEFQSAGTFAVKLIVASVWGCVDSITMNVTINPGPSAAQPSFTYSVNNFDLTTINEGYNGNSYVWDWGENNDTTHAYNSAYNYTSSGVRDICLTVRDTSNCEADSCQTVNIGGCNAKFSFSKDTTSTYSVLLHDSSSGASLSYLWLWGDGGSSTVQNPTHDYDTFGKYLVSLTVNNVNCRSTYSDSIGMDSSGNLYKKQGFSIKVVNSTGVVINGKLRALIYPNPNNGSFTVDVTEGVEIERASVLDLNGRVINASINRKGRGKFNVQCTGLARGNYILVLETSQGLSETRFIVQ